MSNEDPPTLQDVDDMFKEYREFVHERREPNRKAIWDKTTPECQEEDCQISNKLDEQSESLYFHWDEAMERARVAGEQKRQHELDEFAALKVKREQDGQQPGES